MLTLPKNSLTKQRPLTNLMLAIFQSLVLQQEET